MILSFLAHHPLAHTTGFYLLVGCAALGSTLFALRLIAMTCMGLGDLESHDIDHIDHHGIDHQDTVPLKMVTVHSLAGFMMMFGWVSLYASALPHTTLTQSIAYGCICGIIMLAATVWVMRLGLLLESKGTQFTAHAALGLTATVYQEIPAHEFGKILVTVDSITRELLACSADEQPIPSFTPVVITKVLTNEAVEVIIQTEERA